MQDKMAVKKTELRNYEITKLLNGNKFPRFRNLVIRKFSNSLSAFTLIELLVVISIIGVLITLTFVAIIPIQRKSRDARRKADVNTFLGAANLFKADFKIYPNPTFYLGSYGTAGNSEANSNFGLAGDIPACNSATIGPTSAFANLTSIVPATTSPTTVQLDANPVVMKPGFVAVNNFMICFRYIDKALTDPKPASAAVADQYQYRVSYDYGDVLVAAKLENGATDTDATQLFTVTAGDPSPDTTKRYYKGSGVVVRQLDDSSDRTVFFSNLSGTNSDGSYLYQCKVDSLGVAIARDNRVNNEPITSGAAGFAANANCQNAALGLDVEPSN